MKRTAPRRKAASRKPAGADVLPSPVPEGLTGSPQGAGTGHAADQIGGKTLVLEVLIEPLPARFVRATLEQVEAGARDMLERTRLGCSKIRVLGTMRRIILILEGAAAKTEALSREVQGPPARLLKDAEGRYTPQSEGFARKHGLGPEQLSTVQTPKGEFLAARVAEPGETASAILSRELPALLSSLRFPKTMEWEESRFVFARPVRGLLALHGSHVVPFSVAGVRSGRLLHGLAGTGKKPVRLAEARRYEPALRNLAVIADPAERKELLLKRLDAAARCVGGCLEEDEALLEETVFMTEHPVPVAGRFRPEFLELPEALIKTVLKKQMYCFSVRAPSGLCPAFVAVRDGVSEGQREVCEGYEGVLEARLEDAAFYLRRDLKSRLESKVGGLKDISFQKGLGSMADKAGRVRDLAAWICGTLQGRVTLDSGVAGTIAGLAYADLVCEVIREFPELQGAMGAHYARRDGLDERVASGMEQFYFPLGPSTPMPASGEAAAAALAAKLDSLACHFAAGNIPSATADPYALRRQALGAVRIVLEKDFPLPLDDALAKAMSLVPVDEGKRGEALGLLREFVLGRVISHLEESGFPSDAVRSVKDSALGSLPALIGRLKAIEGIRSDPQFVDLCQAFKRAANILKSAKLNGDDAGAACAPARDRFQEPAELELFDSLEKLEREAGQAAARQDFAGGIRLLASVKGVLDRFFDKVLVMAEDEGLRKARLGLLSRLVRCFRSFADLSELAAAPRHGGRT